MKGVELVFCAVRIRGGANEMVARTNEPNMPHDWRCGKTKNLNKERGVQSALLMKGMDDRANTKKKVV